MTALLVALLLQQGMPKLGDGPTINMQMPDPARISGIPLPAADMPQGSVRVRVIRNEMTEVVPGAVVELVGEGDMRKATTDEGGHATFEKLKREVTYKLVTTIDGKRIESRSFEGPRAGGFKFMLALKAAGLPPGGAAPGGMAPGPEGPAAQPAPTINPLKGTPVNPNDAVPAGTIEVRVQGADGKPLAKQPVELFSITKEQKMDRAQVETDASGIARFEKIAPAADVGHLVVTKIDGTPYNSAPFKMPLKPGMLIELRGYRPTRDSSQIVIGRESHVAIELTDGQLRVFENMVLENRGDATYDPGPDGLLLPLPEGSEGAQPASEMPAQLQIVPGKGVAWKGPIPPGRTMIGFGFMLPIDGDTLTFKQPMPFAMDGLRVIVEKTDQMTIDGPSVKDRKEREIDGRQFVLVGSQELEPAGGTIEVTLRGLPAVSHGTAYAALAIALSFVFVTILLSWSPPRRSVSFDRRKLDRKREHLLDELASLEAARIKGASTDTQAARRNELVGSLEKIYRQLDTEEAA